MEGVRAYLISVIAVCMISVPAVILVKKPAMNRVVRLVGGVLILLVAIRPLLHLDMKDVSNQLEVFLEQYQLDTSFLTEKSQEMADYIRAATEDYIEEQASAVGAILQAEVRLSGGDLPVPVHVKLTGTANSAQIERLCEILTEDLDIPPEQQEWSLYGEAE